MQMLWLAGIPAWIFVFFLGAKCVADFLLDKHYAKWWSFPSWMTFGLVSFPAFIAGLVFFAWLAFA